VLYQGVRKTLHGGLSGMTLKQIAALGWKLASFLAIFADCFGRKDARQLLAVYVKGQLSDIHRKNVEAIALEAGRSPRTLQRFLESIKWDEERLRDRCQELVASEHSHPEAIGCIDESGTAKSGCHTAGVARQYNGNRGKIENSVVSVHLSYSAPGFQTLLDSTLYLPKDWADDPERRKKLISPTKLPSKPSHRSPLTRLIGHWRMVLPFRPGRLMNFTVGQAHF
jgi:SRSO17 transposase